MFKEEKTNSGGGEGGRRADCSKFSFYEPFFEEYLQEMVKLF